MQENSKNTRRNVRVFFLVVLTVLASLAVGVYWWFWLRGRVSTDDAYVMADSATISSRIPGTVLKVCVENDELVEVGDILVELDPADYRLKVDEAEAALSRVEAQIKLAKVSLQLTDSQTLSRVEAAEAAARAAHDRVKQVAHLLEQLRQKRNAIEADFSRIRKDFKRYRNLYKRGVISGQQWDNIRSKFKQAKAKLEGVDAEIKGAEASLSEAKQGVDRAEAQLVAARSDRLRVEIERHKLDALVSQRDEIKARLEQARLYLSYCKIKAPIKGYIAQKRVQVGDRLQPGQPILAIVPLDEVYVEANFKETQLKDVRIGQPAEVRADIYPDVVYHGVVSGIRAGTGAAFSLLPPENATGNWIKIVQRVPVKIKLQRPLPKGFPLRVGLSLEVTVDTRYRNGPRLISPDKRKRLASID